MGYGQLDWKLRSDARITVLERTNFRHLSFDRVGRKIDLIVIDASFISLQLLLPKTREIFLKPGGRILALVKPQFEAGPEEVGKRGLVNNEDIQKGILEELETFSTGLDYKILGKNGIRDYREKKRNREFFPLPPVPA
ncbi:MAG: hypothetical protein Ct9H90mP8_0340 [Pseudomonadota bacterium]|nr:MAG: hypothetical protein Ct9H90mP8_0340 [Pseudomonadota bacterium]